MRLTSSSLLGRQLRYLITGERSKRLPKRKPRRGPVRDWRYKDWIRSLPCCTCGRPPRSEAAHTGTDGGKSMKASDRSCVPLCFWCHSEYDNGMRGNHLFEQGHHVCFVEKVKELNQEYDENVRRAA